MAENGELYQYLYKLAGTTQETIDAIFSALWSTRRTGLRPPKLSHFQSLLNLSSPSQLLPVIEFSRLLFDRIVRLLNLLHVRGKSYRVAACLRSISRKCVYEYCDDADVLRTLPPDLPNDLAEEVVVSLRKGVNRWKEELRSQKVMNE